MKLFDFLKVGKKKKEKELELIESLFEEGKIILPTDIRDYIDLEEFKEKTKDIPSLKEKLNVIEDNSKERGF